MTAPVIATEARNGMFEIVRTDGGGEYGYMGFNEVLAGRAAGTINVSEIKLQVCEGCGEAMRFEDRRQGAGIYGYIHTYCGFSGKYR